MSLHDKLGMKDFDTMVSDTLQAIVDSGVGITNTVAGSVIRTIMEAILDNVDTTNYYAGYVYDAIGIDGATGDDLDRLVLILGIMRRQPTEAIGVVTFSTGDAPYAYDIPIPYGFEISTRQGSDGSMRTYTVNEEDVVLKAGETSIDVEVKAEVAGHQYLPAGSLCIMSKSLIGIATVANKNEINSGSDMETDAELRKRTKEYATSFGKCTDNALKVAVESINGVVNCVVVDQYAGVGTSAIIVVTDILPATEDVTNEIDTVVAETKASGIKVFVVYPTIKYIDLDITITEEINSELVLEAVSNYVNSLKVGQTFVIKQMERKILNVIDDNDIENDDIDITTTLPAGNVTCESEEIIRVGSITVNGVVYDV